MVRFPPGGQQGHGNVNAGGRAAPSRTKGPAANLGSGAWERVRQADPGKGNG